MNQTFEQFLKDFFLELREYNGQPIIKDNFERLFDQWLESKDVNDIIEFAELWGKGIRIEAKEEMILTLEDKRSAE